MDEDRNHLYDLIGHEGDLDDHDRRLASYVRSFEPAMVGALHLTCADEAELECIKSFQHSFVDPLLPSLRFWDKAPFRLANLGGRYEWGAVRIAEQHFETPATAGQLKVMVVKVNAHVGVEREGERLVTGNLHRYDLDSPCCGALRALIDGSPLPAVEAIRQIWLSEDPTRLERLLDPARVAPELAALAAAVINAKLQAHRAVIDLQEHEPRSPTIYIVVPCVSLNREGSDGEIICGIYHADCRTPQPVLEYCGLGDDVEAYRIELRLGKIVVEDESGRTPRPVRDHRALIADRLGEPAFALPEPRPGDAAHRAPGPSTTARLHALVEDLGERAPVPTALHLFAHGFLPIHNAFRAHRLVQGSADAETARLMIGGFSARLATLPEADQGRLLELLSQGHAPPPHSGARNAR